MVYPESKSFTEAEVSLLVEAVPAVIWKPLSDFANPGKWDKLTEETKVLSEKKTDVGAKRQRRFSGGTTVIEEIEQWQDGREFKTKWNDMWLPWKKATMISRVVDAGRGSSVVNFKLVYTPRLWIFGWMLDYFIIKPYVEKILEGQLKDLEAYCVK